MRSKHDEKTGGGNLDGKHRQFLNMPERRNSRKEKDWWAPLWKGLMMDRNATHFQNIGIAFWLYAYLIVNANRSSGVVMRRAKTISTDMGLPRSTIFRWMKTLRDAGYIETQSSGHSLAIKIRKWRTIGEVSKLRQEDVSQVRQEQKEVSELGHQKNQSWDTRSPKSGTSETLCDTPKPAWLSEKLAAWSVPKKNILKKNNIKKRIDKIDFKDLDPKTFNTREELLAYDLAKAFKDFPGYPLYLTLARQHPESLLRETAGRVLEVPADEIRTSRGALFNFLIHQNENQSTNGPGR